MRKITAGLFISLDGVVEAPDQWHFPYFNDEMGAAVDATLGAADTMLFGRKTYDSFAGAWPEREAAGGEDAGFAKKLGDARKIVVSNQKLEFTWRNSEQLEGDLVEAVTALKNEPGGGHRAERLGLRRPPAAGGRAAGRAAPAGAPDRRPQGHAAVRRGRDPIPLRLLSSETFATGVLHLVYARAESTGEAGYEEAKAHLPQSEE